MRTDERPQPGRGLPEEPDEARTAPARRSAATGRFPEADDLVAGSFDQTNGVVAGLDGESDGTIDGENLPAAFRTGSLRAATLWDPHPVPPPMAEEDEREPDAGSRRRRPGHRR
jgi:hypothetical protein